MFNLPKRNKEEVKKIRELVDKINILGKELIALAPDYVDNLLIKSRYDRKDLDKLFYSDSIEKSVWEEED